MAVITPIYLNGWTDFVTTIKAPEVRGEFQNIYGLINGNLDGDNIKTGALRGSHFVDDTIPASKLQGSIPFDKLSGSISANQLPGNIIYNTGGTLSGTLTFDLPSGTALIKNADTEETVLYEGGATGSRIRILIGGPNLFRITLNGGDMFVIQNDGTVNPAHLKIPVS